MWDVIAELKGAVWRENRNNLIDPQWQNYGVKVEISSAQPDKGD